MKNCFRPILLLLLLASSASGGQYLKRFVASDKTRVRDVATDAAGNVFVCGETARPTALGKAVRFGPKATGSKDAFLMKFGPDGRRLAAIVFGGGADDSAARLRVDTAGNVVVSGYTVSTDFPTRQPLHATLRGGYDAFVSKFNGTNLLFSTYLGGDGGDQATALALDGQGDILVAGGSSSADFFAGTNRTPSFLSFSDLFLVKLAADGSQVKSGVRFGDQTSASQVQDMAVDSIGNAVLVGLTQAIDFPTVNAFQPAKPALNSASGFVTKIAPNGVILFSTFLAGDCSDLVSGVAVNEAGEILVAGLTCSAVFPAAGPTWPPESQLSYQGFLAKLDPTGSAVLSTNVMEGPPDSQFAAIALTPDGNVLAAGSVAPGVYTLGIPLLTALSPSNSTRTFFDASDCATLARPERMAVDPAGNVVTIGFETRRGIAGTGSYVARYPASTVSQPNRPTVRILSPKPGEVIPPRSTLPLHVAVTGATGAVQAVSYFDGTRLIGVATNSPFGFVWTNVAPATHSLRAVARLEGGSVTSCVSRVTAIAPRNDPFSQATRLVGERVAVRGTTSGATSEADEGSFYGSSVWYSWIAPRDGVFEFKAESAVDWDYEVTALLNVSLGSSLDNLVTLSETSFRQRTILGVRRGTNYQIRLGSYTGRPFLLTIRPLSPPAHDSFANARVLRGETPTVLTSTRNASTQPGEPFAYYSGTTWHSWTAPASGLFLATVDGPGPWPQVSVFTGSSVSNLTPVAQAISGTLSGAAWTAQAGVRYFLQLWGSDTPNLTLKIARATPPPNDAFTDRIRIPPPGSSVTGSLVGASAELGEPGNYVISPPVTTVWYTWSTPTAGVYRLQTTTFARSPGATGTSLPIRGAYSPALLFTGDAVSQLVSVPAELTGDSTIFHASPGIDYQVQLRGGTASFALEVLPMSAPVNDAFDNALPLTGVVAAASGSTVGASLELNEPTHGGGTYEQFKNSIWYRWTAPSNGVYSLSANSSVLAVYTGNSLGGLTAMATNASSHALRLTGGVEYRIAVVSGWRFTLIISPAAPPDNDDFAHRRTLVGLHTGVSITSQDATVEPGEPAHAGSPAQRSVWFAWTAPSHGNYRLWSTNYSVGRIALYTGSALTELTPVAATSDYRGLEVDLTGGTTYQIAVELNHYWSMASFEIRHQPPPPNDAFAKRIRLTGDRVSLVASNAGATREPGESTNGPSAIGRTVWWSWRAPKSGHVTFSVVGAGGFYFNPSLRLYIGTAIGNLFPLTFPNDFQPAVNIPVNAGQEVHISVDGTTSTPSGRFRLELGYTTPPGNDGFSQRLPFAGQASGTFEGGSREPGEPWQDSLEVNASVWWKWKPAASGVYELNLTPSSYPAGIRVFHGGSFESLTPHPEVPDYRTTQLRVRVVAGSNYVIQLVSHAAGKTYSLQSRFFPPPPNDHFAQRIPLHGTNLTVTGSNIAATAEPGEPAHDGSEASRSAWWSWTAPGTGGARIQLVGYYSERIAVYRGESLSTLELVEEGAFDIAFEVTAGTTYHIAFDKRYGPYGMDPLTWSLTFHPPPSNDDFANRLALSGAEVRSVGSTIGATVEPGEPRSPHSGGNSIWWKWTAPESGRYTFAVSNASSSVILTLFAGTNLHQLAVLASNDWTRPILNIPVSAGTELAISVDTAAELSLPLDPLALTIHKVAPPPNDDFAYRIPLTGGPARGNLEGSSVEPGEPIVAPDGASIWWSFTATNQGWHAVEIREIPPSAGPWLPGQPPLPSLPGLDGYARGWLYAGTNLATLSGAPGRNDQPVRLFQLNSGAEYQLQVTGESGWFGPIEARVVHVPAPLNDQFANAIEIQGDDVVVTGSNTLATVEPNEPIPTNGLWDSVWWKWTATTDGVYSITRTNSPVPAHFLVGTGSTVSNLTVVPHTAYSRGPGEYLFRASAGTTYFISAVSYFSSEGLIRFRFNRATPPPNDDFDDRLELLGTSLWLAASNYDATAEPGDPIATIYGQQTIWWKWTAPVSGWTTIDAQSRDHGLDGAVYRGNALTNLILEASAQLQFPLSRMSFQAEAGVEYALGLTTLSGADFIFFRLDVSGPALVVPLQLPAAAPPQVIETSTNLVDWIPFATNASGQHQFHLVPDRTQPQRYFRVR